MSFPAQLIGELRSLRVVIERQHGDRDRLDMPLTRDEVAAYLNVYPDTLYEWAVEEGRIAYSRLGKGAKAPLRFDRKELDDFLRRQRIATVKETGARHT